MRLTEPGTLFKNLTTILRDVVICYDGTMRNICSNSIIQLKHMECDETDFPCTLKNHKAIMDLVRNKPYFVGVIKEILQTKVGYKAILKIEKLSCFGKDCSYVRKVLQEGS